MLKNQAGSEASNGQPSGGRGVKQEKDNKERIHLQESGIGAGPEATQDAEGIKRGEREFTWHPEGRVWERQVPKSYRVTS